MSSDKHLQRFVAAILTVGTLVASPVSAVEGGTGAYFLGSRDVGAGILAPPGIYFSMEITGVSGEVAAVSFAGSVLTNAELEVTALRATISHIFAKPVFGGNLGYSINVPFTSSDITFTGVLGGAAFGELSDSTSGLSDISIVPMAGWHRGRWHYSLTAPIYVPTGHYQVSTFDIPGRSADVLNTSKNKFAIDPTLAATYFDTDVGFSLTGAIGVTVNQRNDATDYKNGDELHIETALGKHYPSGLMLGLSGYYYQQLNDDTGSGADRFRLLTGASSLEATVYGVGPIVSFRSAFGVKMVTFKLKYHHEFGGKRRFESDVLRISANIPF